MYIKRAREEAEVNRVENEVVLEDWKMGMVPIYIVIPVQILSFIWKSLAILICAMPLYFVLFAISTIDWVLDWIFLFTFGLFCIPCAGFFIWAINIAMLPFTIFGWIFRIILETFALPVDGWMLPLGLSGCYLNWGHQCWFKADRSLRNVLDIPLFNTLVPAAGMGVDNIWVSLKRLITRPEMTKASDILHVRR